MPFGALNALYQVLARREMVEQGGINIVCISWK
jgi:hypothetical protein